jgi:DNA polymerase-3 subunit delta'
MPFSDITGHDGPKAILTASLRHDRIAHAYLFHGEDGIGKRLTAVRFAQAVNCETADGTKEPDACGTCRSCHQIEAHTHPDYLFIEPDREQASQQIKIERIRELEQQIVYKPLVGRRKICLIDDADHLTPGAANALLKTLEEPADHSLFLLVTSRPSSLPGTVHSRCQAVRFVTPPRSLVERTLTSRGLSATDARLLSLLTEGRIGQALRADLAALRAQRDEFFKLLAPRSLKSAAAVLSAAEALHRAERAEAALEWIGRWARDLLLLHAGADHEQLMNLDRLADLTEAARHLPPEVLLELLAQLEAFERGATRHLNQQMALENVLLRLRDAVSPALPTG